MKKILIILLIVSMVFVSGCLQSPKESEELGIVTGFDLYIGTFQDYAKVTLDNGKEVMVSDISPNYLETGCLLIKHYYFGNENVYYECKEIK